MALNIGIGVKSVVSCIQKGGLLNRVFTQRGLAWTSSLWHAENASVGIDIGLPVPHKKRRDVRKSRGAALKEHRLQPDLEAQARHRTLRIPLDKVKEVWEETSGPYHTRDAAAHYGIFKDLFDGAEFVPLVPLKITYEHNQEEGLSPVHRGNFVTPSEAAELPEVSFEAEKGSLWTLLMTNPDGHLLDNEAEYVHWMVGNIPGSRVGDGEVLADYLPPFPARGTGYQRLVFILFKQNARIEYNEEQKQLPCCSLAERTFKTLDFYKKHQDVVTPAGLSFFQSRWDPSVQHTYHSILQMREPVFEYISPKQYIAPQVKWPHRKPLHYLNKFLKQK